MQHKRIHKDLIFFLGNELPERRKAAVEEHLGKCADCRNFLAFLKEELEILEKEKNPEVSPFFYTRLTGRLEEKTEHSRQPGWLRLLEPAFFSLLLIAGVYAGIRMGSQASAFSSQQTEVVGLQLMNDFEAEPIESFLLE